MRPLPLLGFAEPDSPLVRGDRQATRGAFAEASRYLAARLPSSDYAINLCQDRYFFMVGFAAACLRGQTNLLPVNQARGALQALAVDYPNHHVLDDISIDKLLADRAASASIQPESLVIDADHIAAICFTSGSTGKPQPHTNTWRTLVAAAQRSAAGLFVQPNLSLTATVPPQHMFGLETSVLQPLFNRCSIHTGRPFFPADVAATLAALPAPRALITTPAHLRACVAAAPTLPPLAFVLSATAPLPTDLAARAESQWQTQVLEIYGSTETGAIATRRTTAGTLWTALPGGSVRTADGLALYRADGATNDIVLHDSLVCLDADHFELAGRNADLIKIAGKRASLAELNARLLAIPGVKDGVIFQPVEDGRVAALVVTDFAEVASILSSLRAYVDEVFLPRPLRIVDSLPRDALGKLPRARLLAAIERP